MALNTGISSLAKLSNRSVDVNTVACSTSLFKFKMQVFHGLEKEVGKSLTLNLLRWNVVSTF